MEDSAIKSSPRSPNTACEMPDGDNSRTKTGRDPKLADVSIILVDKYKFNDKAVDNPVRKCQNKIKSEDRSPGSRAEKIHRVSGNSAVDDMQAIVKQVKYPVTTVPGKNLPPVAVDEKIIASPARSQASSCKETVKISPVLTRSRRVLAEKQIPYSGNIFLRSRRRKVSKLKGARVSDENKSPSDENSARSTDERSSSPGGNSDPGRKESEPNSKPLSLGDEKRNAGEMGTKETVPYEGRSLMDKILFKSNQIVGSKDQSNDEDNAVWKNTEESVTNKSSDTEKDAIEPKKIIRYRFRRRCSEPLKNETVQTRQSRSITLKQINNEFQYSTPCSKTGKCSPFQTGEGGDGECSIVCAPDVYMTDCSQETNSKDNKKRDAAAKLVEENNREQRTSEDNFHTLNLMNQKNGETSKTPPDIKRAVQKESNCSRAKKKAPLRRKHAHENSAEDPERKVGHVRAQAMPVYVGKIAVAKNDNMRKSPRLNSEVKVFERSENGEDKIQMPATEAETVFDSISLRSKTSKSTGPKLSHSQDGNTDSDGTLSNIESIPNSPAQKPWHNVTAGKLIFGDKCGKPNSEPNNSRERTFSSGLHQIPATKNLNTELQSTSIRTSKQPNADISSKKTKKSKLRYYVETSEKQNASFITAGSEKDAEDIADNDGGLQDTPWLRHYERPSSTNKNKGSSSTKIGNSASNNQPARKRGRPRKQDTQASETNTKKKQKSSTRNTVNNAAGGSRLTLRELEQLFFKYFQDGHFRVDPRQRPIIIYSNDLHKNFTSRMQCFDPPQYVLQPCNTETKTNSEVKTALPPNSNVNRFCPPSNSTSGQFEHRTRTSNSNSQNLSNQTTDETTHPRNYNSCGTRTNISSYTNSGQCETHGNNFNENAQMYSVSSYMQSGYGAASSSYQQNYYHNGNLEENNSYFNNHSGGMVAATDSTKNISTSINNNNEFNYSPYAQQHHQNLMLYKEIDLTNNATNSMQNSPTNNVTNNDWNAVNSALDSVSGILMDLNSTNHANGNEAVGESPDSNNLTIDQNSMMNDPNPWMNRTNNTTNSPYSIMQPRRESFPMYNPYPNNDSQYYNNMFNPYSAYMGFGAYTNNINARNVMGINNENPWVQNYHAGYSNFNGTYPQFSSFRTGSLQESSMNQGINLSLPSNTVTDPQRNTTELDDSNLSIRDDSGLNSSMEQMEGNILQVEQGINESVEENVRGYGEQTCLPYPLGYKNNTETLDFDEVDKVNVDDQQEENQPQIEDFMHQRLASFEGCFQRYVPDGSTRELTNNRETEISKLRQELADFTKQYSEDQTSPTSQILQENEIFDCMMTQDLDSEESSTS